MRNLFSTKVKIILVVAALLTAALAIYSGISNQSLPSVIVQGVLAPFRAAGTTLTNTAEKYYSYMFRYEALDAENKVLEERIAQRDAKIDALYVKLRNEQSDKLAWIHKCHELELQLKDAEHNRCDRPDSECGRRIPPRRTTLIKDKEEKKNG